MLQEIQTGRENKILRAHAQKVQTFDKKLANLIRDLKETLIAAKGLGLAAPQIGLSQCVIVVKLQLPQNENLLALVNPVITQKSAEWERDLEGCLSLPNESGYVTRPKSVRVEFQNPQGQKTQIEFTDLNARIVQHEIDHLKGILYTDYAAQIKSKKPALNFSH